MVHARGAGAYGYFEPCASCAEFTRAAFLQDPSVRTPVFVRFSTVQGRRGSVTKVDLELATGVAKGIGVPVPTDAGPTPYRLASPAPSLTAGKGRVAPKGRTRPFRGAGNCAIDHDAPRDAPAGPELRTAS
ncbi:catalase HPII [Streptomyces scabiei]|uniref:catalase n=1 Tax=Streptomyces scabiei TaxID=1930 RepID=A0A100JSC8_STRSC|nr:catalase HPII [Streptomyces scabiei]